MTSLEAIGIAVVLIAAVGSGWAFTRQQRQELFLRGLERRRRRLTEAARAGTRVGLRSIGNRQLALTLHLPLPWPVHGPLEVDSPLGRPDLVARLDGANRLSLGPRRAEGELRDRTLSLTIVVRDGAEELTLAQAEALAAALAQAARRPLLSALEQVPTAWTREARPDRVLVRHELGLPLCVERGGSSTIGHPMLDMLVGVETEDPAAARELLEPVAEPLLALVHGHPGSRLEADELLVVVGGALDEAGWIALLEQVEALLAGLTDCQPPVEPPEGP